MRVLVDTNVIGRISQTQHPMHVTAIAATRRLFQSGHDLRVVPQVLYEFWSVATRPFGENGFGFSIEQSRAELKRIKSIFPPLRDERGILEPWESLVVSYTVRGKSTHDARLVAAMRRHSITHLLTFDASDFARFDGVTVIHPAAIGST